MAGRKRSSPTKTAKSSSKKEDKKPAKKLKQSKDSEESRDSGDSGDSKDSRPSSPESVSSGEKDSELFDLPSLTKMIQSDLRSFIPKMIKYSTGRGKPGWGNDDKIPPWWPKGLPWANVKSDPRSEDEKEKTSWTLVLRQLVVKCYTYHGRKDLLKDFKEHDDASKK